MAHPAAVPHRIMEAAPGHLPLIGELAARIWPAAYRGILTPEQISNMLENIYAEDSLKAELAGGYRFWIVYARNVPSGFISAYKEDDTIWIRKLYIDPVRQKHGLGTALIRHAVAAFSPAARVSLLVNPNNTPAQGYYRHAGFTRIGGKRVKMGDFEFTDDIYSRPLTEKATEEVAHVSAHHPF